MLITETERRLITKRKYIESVRIVNRKRKEQCEKAVSKSKKYKDREFCSFEKGEGGRGLKRLRKFCFLIICTINLWRVLRDVIKGFNSSFLINFFVFTSFLIFFLLLI